MKTFINPKMNIQFPYYDEERGMHLWIEGTLSLDGDVEIENAFADDEGKVPCHPAYKNLLMEDPAELYNAWIAFATKHDWNM